MSAWGEYVKFEIVIVVPAVADEDPDVALLAVVGDELATATPQAVRPKAPIANSDDMPSVLLSLGVPTWRPWDFVFFGFMVLVRMWRRSWMTFGKSFPNMTERHPHIGAGT